MANHSCVGLPVGLNLKINDLTSRGMYAEALEMLREPLANHPENAELLAMAGRCALELGYSDYALQCLEYARVQAPGDLGLAQELGTAYRRCGRFDKAVELFEALSAQHPDLPQLVGQRGLTYLARGDRQLAEADLRCSLVRMLANSRDLGPANLHLAHEARAALQKLGLEFPLPDAEVLKLLHLRDIGDLKELMARCTIDLKRPQPWLYFLRGCARLGLGSHREAIADLTQALELEPNLIEAYRYRGDAWAKSDRLRAAADYHRYLELGDPRAPDILGKLGLMYFDLRRIDEALSPLETSLDLAPDLDDGSCWEALGRCYLGKGRQADALRAFNQALATGSNTSPELRYLRGTILEQRGALEQAITDYQAYLRESPQGPAAGRATDRLTELERQMKSAARNKGFLSQLFGRRRKLQ